MPPSQLKRLKSSLREQGITGAQKSKKQKKSTSKDQLKESRIRRNVALQQIRDSFNPFELRQASRPVKFENVSRESVNASRNRYKDVLHRPGVSKSVGEEMRRKELLPELQKRNKTGGLIDRRIGEGDPALSVEGKALQRFALEKSGKTSVFDLEGSDDDQNPNFNLTHMGRRLEDFDEDDLASSGSGREDSLDDGFMQRKRRLSPEGELSGEATEDQPERKKTKKEVMEEVIAKSKMHKYERQKVKEDDEELRDQLDGGMAEMLALLQRHKTPIRKIEKHQAPSDENDTPRINPDRLKLMDPSVRVQADKEYEVRLRQLAQDTRAKPSERALTEEEKAQAETERLKELETKRNKRMGGEPVSEDEVDVSENENVVDEDVINNDDVINEAVNFGFARPIETRIDDEREPTYDDEDDFALDDDLVANSSEIDSDDINSDISEDDSEYGESAAKDLEDEEDEFVRGVFSGDPDSVNALPIGNGFANGQSLSSTSPCPQTHAELLEMAENASEEQFFVIVKRIRAVYHPSLSAGNKETLGTFASVLVDHLAWMGNQKRSLTGVEQLIRHLHSLSRTYALEIASAFRRHLSALHLRGNPTAGDLVILTAIGSIYPTSDHFHQVVTPTITLVCKWLGLNSPMAERASVTGAYLIAVLRNYQKLSKRFVPEAVRFTLKALSITGSITMMNEHHVTNLLSLADLWKEKSAFIEIFEPALSILQQIGRKKEVRNLQIMIQQAKQRRRPLELQHHRAKAIRSSIPKFEDDFNPDKHYDPDKERSDAKKLQKEYNRERKGALRELRKDANFIAREQLREKKIRDAEYEKKQRRLIAEIQGEEGHEAKVYEREKRKRKAGK